MHLPDIAVKFGKELKRRNWENSKLLQACQKFATLKDTTALGKVTEALRESHDRIAKSILKQDSPLVRTGLAGHMGKGAFCCQAHSCGDSDLQLSQGVM